MTTLPLTWQERRMLAACLLPPPRAAEAWRELLADMPLADLPNSLTRALPHAYLTLRTAPDVPHLDLLRGAYRASWTANLVRIGAAKPLLVALRDGGVDYRLVKGGAICGYYGSWGLRRMGDLDLLARRSEQGVLTAALRARGFSPRFAPRGFAQEEVAGLWCSDVGGEVDLGLVDSRGPLYDLAFGTPGRWVDVQGVPMHVPAAAGLLGMAIGHGVRRHGDTDYLQMLLDVGRLVADVAPEVGVRIVNSAGLRTDALDVMTTLTDLGVAVPPGWAALAVRPARERRDDARRAAASIGRDVVALTRAPALIARRRVDGATARAAGRTRGGRGLGYECWLRAGRLRPAEAAAVRAAGGFLPAPSVPMEPGTSVDVRVRAGVVVEAAAQVAVGAVPSADLRIRLRRTSPDRSRLTIEYPHWVGSPRLLYVNGRTYGALPQPSGSPIRIDVPAGSASVELSIRPLVGTDPLDADLRVSLG